MSTLYPDAPVLIVDDEQAIRSTIRSSLLLAGISNVVEAHDGSTAITCLQDHLCAAVVLDLLMPQVTGLELLERMLQENPGTPVIVATGVGELDTAVKCMRAGAFDYLTKPIGRTRLITSVRHAIEKWETAREVNSLTRQMLSTTLTAPEAFSHIITRDPAMLAIFKYAESIGSTSLPVLITGETGVGKELFARALHSLSGRDGKFVPVNVAGLDDTLFSDTLFGHVKGAYTGADSTRDGMVAKAEGGTLFLDEIGDLVAESQIKLLRLLQEKEYHPLGTDQPRPTNARFVFATNLDLADASKRGRFRNDLLYRLTSHHIRIPPLRERLEDLELLVDHFFDRASAELGKARPTVPKELIPMLRCYAFPGNIRELAGMVFDAVVRHRSRTLSLDSFRAAIGERCSTSAMIPTDVDGEFAERLFGACTTLPTIKETTALLIDEALKRTGGNQATAARLLGITRTALNKRLNRVS